MPRPPVYGYLKYWKVVKNFIKIKYIISQPELDMLLFLNEEEYFNRDKFKEFNKLFSFDINIFRRLREKGWIEIIKKYNGDRKTKSLYQVSFKTKQMTLSLYKKLDGQAFPGPISGTCKFAKSNANRQGFYKDYIQKLNKTIRQQRHHALE